MIKTIGFYDFEDSFDDSHKNNFSYDGKRALFDYLENYEEETGEQIELDPIALCCEYSEHKTALECALDYSGFTDDTELSVTEREARALEWLQDNTQVMEFDGGIIILDF